MAHEAPVGAILGIVEGDRARQPRDAQPDSVVGHNRAVRVVGRAVADDRHNYEFALGRALKRQLGPLIVAVPDDQRACVKGCSVVDRHERRDLRTPSRFQQERWRRAIAFVARGVEKEIGARCCAKVQRVWRRLAPVGWRVQPAQRARAADGRR